MECSDVVENVAGFFGSAGIDKQSIRYLKEKQPRSMKIETIF